MPPETSLPALVKLVVTAPLSHADAVRQALGAAGAGQMGNYSYCSFSSVGTGRFVPSTAATPFIGAAGALEQVAEERIEVTIERNKVASVIKALRAAHPYEEPAIDLYPLLAEKDFA